jgi:hypothetical protein
MVDWRRKAACCCCEFSDAGGGEDEAVGRTRSGTVVPSSVAAVLTVTGIGNILAQRERLAGDPLVGLAALTGVLLLLFAFLWALGRHGENDRQPTTAAIEVDANRRGDVRHMTSDLESGCLHG